MNILTPNVANTPATNLAPNSNITYAPTAADLNAYGGSWININTLVSGTKTLLKGIG